MLRIKFVKLTLFLITLLMLRAYYLPSVNLLWKSFTLKMGFVADGSLGRVVGEYREKKDQVNSWGYDYQRICFFRKTFRITTFLCVKGKAREMHWKILGEPSMLKIMSLKKISRISKRLRCTHLWRGRWVTPNSGADWVCCNDLNDLEELVGGLCKFWSLTHYAHTRGKF